MQSMSSKPSVFRPHYFICAALAAFLLCGVLSGCLLKDKPDKALTSGGMTPPWDPAKFMPKTLEGFAYAGP
jgi:hypothetical protein